MQKNVKKAVFSAVALMILSASSANAQTSYNSTPGTPNTDVQTAAGNLLQQINNGVYQIQQDVNNGFMNLSQEIMLFSRYISDLVHQTVTTGGHLMFTVSPDLQTTMSSNYGEGVANPVAVGMAYHRTNQELNEIISTNSNTLTVLGRQTRLATLVPAPSSTNQTEQLSLSDEKRNDVLYAPMNLDSLLAPDSYFTNDEQANAQAFIKYVSYATTPFFNLSPLYFANNYLPVQQYRAYYGTYAALQSIGLSNFNELFYQRQPQKGLGTLAGLDSSHPDASVQQVEHHMIVERGLNPQWYAEMETAPPATIERESLYSLAAIQVELYNNNQLLQRLLTTVSAIQLTQTQTEVRHNLSSLQQTVVTDAQMKNNNPIDFDRLMNANNPSSPTTPTSPTPGGVGVAPGNNVVQPPQPQ